MEIHTHLHMQRRTQSKTKTNGYYKTTQHRLQYYTYNK